MGNHADGGKVSAGKAVEPLYAGQRLFDARWRKHQLQADQLRHVRNASSAWASGWHAQAPGSRHPQRLRT